MKVVRDGLWLCEDCSIVVVNGDYSGFDFYYKGAERDARVAAVNAGLERLGRGLVPDYDAESGTGIEDFRCKCACCLSVIYGSFHRFAVLGDE